MGAATRMHLVRLLAPLTTPEGVVPAGEQLLVDEAEARVLRGAVGLVEDLGEVDAEPETTMPGQPGTADAALDAPPAAPAVSDKEGAEANSEAEAGPVSAEGQAATPGDAEAAAAAEGEAGEAAGASNDAGDTMSPGDDTVAGAANEAAGEAKVPTAARSGKKAKG